MKKQAENKKPLSIEQVLVDTNTDDSTITQYLDEEDNPEYKPPYSKAFIKKHNLNKPTQTE